MTDRCSFQGELMALGVGGEFTLMAIMSRIAVGLVGVVLLLFLLSLVNHRVRTAKEVQKLATTDLEHLVEINGYRVNVYAEGQGGATLVFMAGSGTSAPTLDFKPLWAGLSSDYRIVVVERAGYGFSDVVRGIPRDIDSVLAESRLALQRAGETAPFILAPHSMSALEAIYWAHNYPDEVKAIIGIDPAIPETYEHLQIPPHLILRLMSLFTAAGITRFIPNIATPPAIQTKYLSENESRIYQGLVHRRMLTANMLAELRVVAKNAQTVQSLGVPNNIPMYFFVSNGKELGVSRWQELLVDYARQSAYGQYLLLDTGHYIHHHEPALMAEAIREFIEECVH